MRTRCRLICKMRWPILGCFKGSHPVHNLYTIGTYVLTLLVFWGTRAEGLGGVNPALRHLATWDGLLIYKKRQVLCVRRG